MEDKGEHLFLLDNAETLAYQFGKGFSKENDLLQKPWKRGGDRACKRTG